MEMPEKKRECDERVFKTSPIHRKQWGLSLSGSVRFREEMALPNHLYNSLSSQLHPHSGHNQRNFLR